MTTKKDLLKQLMLLYWEYDTEPQFAGTDDEPTAVVTNSPEDLLLKVYDQLKKRALASYDWRSATKYATVTPTEPSGGTGDPRYKYSATVPDDFLKVVGYWADTNRQAPAHNCVDTRGTIMRTNLKQFVLEYVADVSEKNLDPWVIDYLMIFIAAEASDIGGISNDRKNFLMAKAQGDWITLTNKDYDMAHHDEVSSSIHQFEIY